jgi:hypothetical protein
MKIAIILPELPKSPKLSLDVLLHTYMVSIAIKYPFSTRWTFFASIQPSGLFPNVSCVETCNLSLSATMVRRCSNLLSAIESNTRYADKQLSTFSCVSYFDHSTQTCFPIKQTHPAILSIGHINDSYLDRFGFEIQEHSPEGVLFSKITSKSIQKKVFIRLLDSRTEVIADVVDSTPDVADADSPPADPPPPLPVGQTPTFYPFNSGEVDVDGTNLTGIDMNDLYLEGFDLEGFDLDGFELDRVELDRVELDRVELDRVAQSSSNLNPTAAPTVVTTAVVTTAAPTVVTTAVVTTAAPTVVTTAVGVSIVVSTAASHSLSIYDLVSLLSQHMAINNAPAESPLRPLNPMYRNITRETMILQTTKRLCSDWNNNHRAKKIKLFC